MKMLKMLCFITLFFFNHSSAEYLKLVGNNTFMIMWSYDIYVSPDGDDNNIGNKINPLKTIQAAKHKARDFPHDKKIIIWIKPGIYYLKEPIRFDEMDSGTDQAPIEYRRWGEGEVIISGGINLTNWENIDDTENLPHQIVKTNLKKLGIIYYGLPSKKEALNYSNLNTYHYLEEAGIELFYNNKRMPLARWPNEGFTTIKDLTDKKDSTTATSQIGSFVYEGDRPSEWIHEKNVWLHGYWMYDWDDSYHYVHSIDTVKKIINVERPYYRFGYRVGQRYYAFNILSELDRPGEWYLNRENGDLYFWPPSGRNKKAVVSMAETLLVFNNTSYVSFYGITFEACRGTAIIIEGGKNNKIENCTIRDIGAGAIEMIDSPSSGIKDCTIYEIGETGIKLTGGDRNTLHPAKMYVVNTHIYNYAQTKRTYRPAIAVYGVGNYIAYNHIHDAPHQAIYFNGNNHIIEYNNIHNVVMESRDAGAIYAGRDWSQRGNIIRYNFIHDIYGYLGKGASAVYLDDLFSGTKIFNNIFKNVYRGVLIGGGRDNIVKKNIFVNCSTNIHIDGRGTTFYKSDEMAKKYMGHSLEKVPWRSKVWRLSYPKLYNIYENDPRLPKGNKIINNMFVNYFSFTFRQQADTYALIKNNKKTKDSFISDNDYEFLKHYRKFFEAEQLENIPVEKN